MQVVDPFLDEPLHVPLPDVLELIQEPGRSNRPKRIAIVLRGPPGSGKSHIARKLRDAEVAAGREAPRIHSIDDYFITVSDCHPDTATFPGSCKCIHGDSSNVAV